MNDERLAERFEKALRAEGPRGASDALFALAKSLKAEGMTQKQMYDLFDSYRAAHKDDPDEALYDAILDTMDAITGWCSPHTRLFDSALKA